MSILQVCLLGGIGLAIYYGYVYGPTKLRYMGMARICDDVAHQMVVNIQDEPLIEEVQSRAREEQGVELSLSQIQLRRDTVPRVLESCRVQWDDKIQPVWAKQPVILHQQVVKTAIIETNLLHDSK